MEFRFRLSLPNRLSPKILALLIGISSAASLTSFSQTAVRAAGDDPVVSVNEQTGGTLQNRQIAAQWKVQNGHLAGLMIRNKSVEESVQDSSVRLGDPFSIDLKGIGVLRASGLTIRGSARVEHLPHDTRSASPASPSTISLKIPAGSSRPTGPLSFVRAQATFAKY
jgi:hypothetical protein